MPFDSNKYLNNAKTPVVSKINPVGISVINPPKTTPFYTQFNTSIERLGLAKYFDGDENQVIKKAINGDFNNILQSKDVDEKVKKDVKGVINNSWSAMNEILLYNNTNGKSGAMDKSDKYRQVADSFMNVIGDALSYDKGKNIVLDNKTLMIKLRKDWEIDTDTVHSGKPYSTQANKGEGKTNPFAGYNQDKAYMAWSMNNVKDKVSPIVQSWGTVAFSLLNGDDAAANKVDPDNRNSTLKYTKDAMTFISKYGTQSGDKQIDGKNKQMAIALLAKLNNGNIPWEKQLSLIEQKSLEGETNVITDAISQMGYYGTTWMYERHKGTMGQNKKYFSKAPQEADNLDSVDALVGEVKVFREFMVGVKDRARKLAITKSNSPYAKATFNALLPEGAEGPVTFDKWLYNMKNVSNSFNKDATRQNDTRRGLVETGYGGMRNVGPNENFAEKIAPLNPGWTFGDFGKLLNIFDSNEKVQKEKLKELYNESLTKYKKVFSDMNEKQIYKGKIIFGSGTGNTANNELFMHVNMSLDKAGNMINTSTNKGNSANGMLNLMRNEDGSINTNDISLMDNADISEGLKKSATKADLLRLKDENEAKYKAFFGAGKLDDVQVTFDRNASLDRHATYTFRNRTTGKSLVMVAPYSFLKDRKEEFWTKTIMSDAEYRYQRMGKKKLPSVDGLYTNAEIRDGKYGKMGSFKYTMTDGTTGTHEFVIGDLNITKATAYFNNFIQNWNKQ